MIHSTKKLLIVLLLLLVGCQSYPKTDGAVTPSATTGMRSGEVEVQIFSGMPNPSWLIDESTVTELSQRVRALPLAPDGTEPPLADLGYSGLIVILDADTQAPVTLSIGRGFVVYQAPDEQLVYEDAGFAVEEWLAQQGASSLEGDIYQIILDDITMRRTDS